jgi:hypothetical protein
MTEGKIKTNEGKYYKIFSLFLWFRKQQHPDKVLIPDYLSVNGNVLRRVEIQDMKISTCKYRHAWMKVFLSAHVI